MRAQATTALVTAALALTVLFLLVTSALERQREHAPGHRGSPAKTQRR